MTTESDLDLITVRMFDVKPEAAGYSSRNTVCVSVVTPSHCHLGDDKNDKKMSRRDNRRVSRSSTHTCPRRVNVKQRRVADSSSLDKLD